MDGDDSPAAENRGIAVSRLIALSSSIPLDVLLAGAGNPERLGRHVVGDHRARRSPRSVSDRHGGDEDIVAAGVDVPADRGAVLAGTELGAVVGGDRAGGDVRPLARSRLPEQARSAFDANPRRACRSLSGLSIQWSELVSLISRSWVRVDVKAPR
jgi:hypothetical protein